MKLTEKQLANYFDHTNLKPFATDDDMRVLCDEAMAIGAKMVAINSCKSEFCRKYMGDSPVNVGAAISFPLGQCSIETKVFETEQSIREGCDEIDYVINIGKLKDKDYDYIKREMQAIVDVCRKHNKISKVIFENCYLEKDEIIKLAEIALEVKPDFIKTSTGFGPSGAKVEDVKLMKQVVGDAIKVKASGGVRDLATALAMIEAGAERIGTSSSLKILEEFRVMEQKGALPWKTM